ncbi:hypothetical protein Q0F99_06580 [Rathayibacter oskolensis]|nr:hypothetical protein [Rathayibacter oskolensis]WKK72595.1 hypothetical protein Q0F99_06580 [Rathayibacter oskolensis]
MIQPGNEYFLPAPSIERSATITRLPQTIRFLPYTGQAAVVGTVQLGASSSANRLVVFSSLTPEVCAVDTPADTYNTQSTGYARTLKAGTCTVAADQPGDESVEPAEQIRTSFDLPKLPQKVSFRTPGVARPGDDDVLLYAGSNYGLPVTVTTSTPDVCTILSDAFVRPLAAGTCTVSVDQPGDDLYLPAERFTRSFEIVRDTQTITYDYPQDIDRHSGASYTPVATADSGLPVTFGATGACTIADGVVTFTEIGGVCTVTADQPGTAGYEPAQQRSRAFTVLKRSQTMTITSTIPETGAVGGTLVVTAEASSGLPVSAGVYGACSSAPDAQGRTVVTFTSVGTCTLNLGQNGNAEYDAAPGQFRTIEVGLPAQTLAFTSTAPATAAPGDTYTVTATGGASGQPVVLGATGACTIADAVVTFTATGTCTITADQAGDDRFQAAAQVSQTVAVGLLAGSVAFGGDAPTDARVGGSSTPVIVEGPSSADPVLAASGACSVASGVVSYDSAGTCTLTLNQAGDPRYGAAPQAVRTFEIARIAQTVAFTSTAPATAVAGGTYTPTATGGPSGKPVLIDATGSCSIASGVVTFTGSGTCTITADQAGDDRHAAAPHASQSIAVGLAAGTVSFGGDAPTGAAVGGSSTPVIVRGPSSADPVLAASGACSVASGVVSYDSAGTCTLTLDQAGDARYGAAPQAVRTFEITRVGQTLVFTSTAPAAVVGGAAYRPAVRGGASSAPVVLGTTTPSVCSVADGSVSFTAAGTCVLTADQAGDATHEAAPRATQSITVKAAVPAVKKAQTIAFTTTMPKAPERGVAYPVAATATSGNPVTFAAKGSCTLTATGRGTATVTLTGAATCTVTATQAGDATWLAAPAVTRTLKVDAATKADLTIAMTPTPGLGSTAPVSGTVTIKNVGTRDAGATTTRVTVSAPVADAPGAVRTPGKVKGTTVLTWTVPTVAAGQSITYTVKLATRPKVTTIDATVSTSLADPTPANNSLSRTVK